MISLLHFQKEIQRPIWVGSVCILLFLIMIIGMTLMTPEIFLIGDQTVVININDDYTDEGAKALLNGKNISKYITISGEVNTKQLGSYKIEYQIKYGPFKNKVSRTVIVKDMESPTITLLGDENMVMNVNDTFKEPGYKAYDNVDGDITEKVTVDGDIDTKKIGSYTLTYQVQDRFGNETSVSRNITVQDKEKPTITLSGSKSITINVNDTFKEPGYKALDNVDGDITKKVKIEGSVNTKKAGVYTLTYRVQDSSGNETSVKRSITVKEKAKVPEKTEDDGKTGVIYLTFDDGPHEGTTNVILDILKEEKVKATFFVTNNGPDSLIKRAYEEGHTVALHTATHDYAKVYASEKAYFDDLKIVHDRVQRITGEDAKIIRFPGGSSNTVSRNYSKGIMTLLVSEVVKRGYHYFDWNISSGDAGAVHTKEKVYNNVISALSKKRANVVLMHDTKTYTRDALRDIIRYGKNHGYEFKAITYDTPMVVHRVSN